MMARRLALPVAVLSLVLTAGCNDDDSPRSPGAGTPGVTGQTGSQSLDGAWVLQSTPLTSTCGSFNTMMEQTAVLTIVQAGNSFDFTMADDCGNPIPGGTGQIDPSGTVQLGTESTRTVNSTCAVRLTQDFTGITRPNADAFSGTNILSLQGQTGQDNCSVTLPCTVNASFNATRCPISGCQVTCTP